MTKPEQERFTQIRLDVYEHLSTGDDMFVSSSKIKYYAALICKALNTPSDQVTISCEWIDKFEDAVLDLQCHCRSFGPCSVCDAIEELQGMAKGLAAPGKDSDIYETWN